MAMVLSITLDDLEKRIRRFVSKGSCIASKWVIPGNDSGPAPDVEPHASVLLVSHTQQGYPGGSVFEDGEAYYGQRIVQRAEFIVQYYGKGAVDTATRFQLWVNSPFAESFENTKIGRETAPVGFRVMEYREVLRGDLPGSEGYPTEYEERATDRLVVDYFADVYYTADADDDCPEDFAVGPIKEITVDILTEADTSVDTNHDGVRESERHSTVEDVEYDGAEEERTVTVVTGG